MYPSSLQQLIDSFKYLPGIGEKTAERLAFAVMDMDDDRVGLDKKLVTALFDACKSQAEEIIAQLEKQ